MLPEVLLKFLQAPIFSGASSSLDFDIPRNAYGNKSPSLFIVQMCV